LEIGFSRPAAHTEAMTIDRMRSSDLPRVLEMNKQFGYDSTLIELQNRFRKIDTNPTHALFAARDENGTALGYVHIHHDPESLLENERAILHALVVHEEARRKKIGAQLLGKAEDWAKSQKLTSIRLRSNLKREDAHRFYRAHGYETKKTSYTFIKTL
jgi:GNAT superfamily N-acetyltransferase